MNDGSVVRAVAVWVQDSVLHYREADGESRQVSLHAIDRATTRRVNAENGLTLSF
jgi:hypothetical protein